MTSWRIRASGKRLAVAGIVALALAALFVSFYRLGTPSWYSDEVTYRNAGLDYVHGRFGGNLEHPPLAKEILGLTELVFGKGPAAVRAPAAVAGLLTGLVLFLLARRMLGLGAGLLAFGLWALLPHAGVLSGSALLPVKVDRFALLDVFMGLFTTASLYAGWRWAESGRWRWAILAGGSVGLATACKAPGVLVLPVVLVTGVVTQRGSSRSRLQAVTLFGVGVLVFVASYAPFLGDAPTALRTVYNFQTSRNAGLGHPIEVAGHLYVHPPWWTLLWFQWKGVGPVATAVMAAAAVAAPFLLPRRVALFLFGAVLLQLVYLSVFLGFALPHYYYAWMPALTLLVAAALRELLRHGRVALGIGLAALLALAGSAIATGVDVARLHSADYAAAASLLRTDHLDDGQVIVWQFPQAMSAYLPHAQVGTTPIPPDIAAIVVDPVVKKRFTNSALAQYLSAARGEFIARRVDRLTVYEQKPPRVARGQVMPTPGATGIDPNVKVRVGALAGRLDLRRTSDGRPVAGTSYRQGGTVVFDPAEPLARGTSYSIRFLGVGGTRSWRFATARSFTASPSNLHVLAGELRAGSPIVLRVPDRAVVLVRSTPNPGPRAALLVGFMHVHPTAGELFVDYTGRTSRRCLQNLGIWNWQSHSWVQLNSGIPDPAGFRLVKSPNRGSLHEYAPHGKVRVRALCQRQDAPFVLVADALTLHYEGP